MQQQSIQNILIEDHDLTSNLFDPTNQSAADRDLLIPSPEQRLISLPTVAYSSSKTRFIESSPAVSYGLTAGYLGETGIHKIFEQDHRKIAKTNQENTVPSSLPEIDLPPSELQQSFAETYFDYCWPWCPILDKGPLWAGLEASPSPLLINALALLGTQIRPPMIQHATASDYYSRAKMLFYTDQEANPIVCLQAIMLFYWWAPRG